MDTFLMRLAVPVSEENFHNPCPEKVGMVIRTKDYWRRF